MKQSIVSVSVIFQTKRQHFQLLKYQDIMLFFVIYDSKYILGGFEMIERKEAWLCVTFSSFILSRVFLCFIDKTIIDDNNFMLLDIIYDVYYLMESFKHCLGISVRQFCCDLSADMYKLICTNCCN